MEGNNYTLISLEFIRGSIFGSFNASLGDFTLSKSDATLFSNNQKNHGCTHNEETLYITKFGMC